MIARKEWPRYWAKAMTLALVAIGCHRHPTSPYGNVPEGTIEANINSIPFAVRSGVYVTFQHGVMSISAQDDAERTIQFALLAPDRPTTLLVGPGVGNSAITGYQRQLWRSNVEGGDGSITFTTVTYNQSAGTFTFRAAAVPGTSSTGVMTVTGAFNLTYDR